MTEAIMKNGLSYCHSLPRNFTLDFDESFLLSLNISHFVVTESPQVTPDNNRFFWFNVIIPIICLIGIIGNVMNLVVLTRRRMLSSMQRLERCATHGLAALALSDLLFCLTVFPMAFISGENDNRHKFTIYYRVYGIALINMLHMVGNWLTVVIAVNRLLVVLYPIHARHFLSNRKTLISIIVVYICSALCTLPYALHVKVGKCMRLNGEIMYEHQMSEPEERSIQMKMYIRWILPVFSVFIPLLILTFSNTFLIHELNKASVYRRSVSARDPNARDGSHKVTLTLIIIILMVTFLGSPSEIIKYIDIYSTWQSAAYLIANILNVLQTLNFACNFFLYCVVNANFRRTIQELFCVCDKGQNRYFGSQANGSNTCELRTFFKNPGTSSTNI